jgi:DNA-binding response OmpR family regulator
MARILWIEGKRAEGPSFIPNLRKKGYSVEVVSTGNAALDQLVRLDPDLAVVNAASLRTSGKRICRAIRERMNGLPIVLIAGEGQPAPTDTCANVVLSLPFTQRKLLNRIVPLLPGNGGHMLHVGPIRLDLKHKRVRCQGREARLTPRLVTILRILMQHPGEVLDRAVLFRQVWVTDYTADTRTLDVHVSWLRKALEEDPRNPQFLKTIRGVGYRLDI